MDTIFVIMRPDGTPFHRDDAMGILATDSEAQAIRFQHAREEEGAEYVRYTRTQPPSAASVSERARTASLKEIVPAEKRNYLDDNGNPRSIEDEAYAHGWNACRAATIRTLEQALTQQRPAAGSRSGQPVRQG